MKSENKQNLKIVALSFTMSFCPALVWHPVLLDLCLCSRYFYRACQGSVFPSPVQVGRQLDRLPPELRRRLLHQSQAKLFPFCRPFLKPCSSTLTHPHPAHAKHKPRAANPGITKSMEMKDTSQNSRNTENHVVQNSESSPQSSTLPYTKDLPPPEPSVLTSTPLLPHTDSVQLVSPPSSGPPGVTYKKSSDVSQDQTPGRLREHSEPPSGSWCWGFRSKFARFEI